MLLETFIGYNYLKDKKENFEAPETWDSCMILFLVLYIIFTLLWVYTIVHGLKMVKSKKSKNPPVSLLTPLISWPFYWVFYYYRVI